MSYLRSFGSLRDCWESIRGKGGVLPKLSPSMEAQLLQELSLAFTQCVVDVRITMRSSVTEFSPLTPHAFLQHISL